MPGAARLGDTAHCPLDSHGCNACPHDVSGKIVQGSHDVEINGKPAAYLGCRGIHGVCCGSNTFEIAEGAPTVFVNGYPAARIGDRTSHCGGSGEIKTGSGNVIIGNGQGRLSVKAATSHAPFMDNIGANRRRSIENRRRNMQSLEETGGPGVYHNSGVPGDREAGTGKTPTTAKPKLTAEALDGIEAKAVRKFKKKHLDGDPGDPYTLMPDGKPMGAEVGKVPGRLKGLDDIPANHDKYVKEGWPSLNVEYRPGRYTRDFRNFTGARPDTLEPGAKIYRIIDDGSPEFTDGISGSYWVAEMPKNKTAWRRDYAVKDSWNDDGYYIEETVGPQGLKVWRGGTAAQEYRRSDFSLRGGQEQIFIHRGTIKNYEPKLTNWPDL